MPRPFRFDDQFKSVINNKLSETFLCLFTIKIQSTAFCQKTSLQKALTISSIFDFIMGLTVFLLFFRILGVKDGHLFFLENVIMILGMFFGLLGFDSAANLNKRNAYVYKYWRILITLFIPFTELFNSQDDICFYYSCSFFYFSFICSIWIVVNLYLTKIAWSFCIRLDRGQELLLIHGNYLETMITEETNKINSKSKYLPTVLTQQSFIKVNELREIDSSLIDEYTPNKHRNPLAMGIKFSRNGK